MVALVSGGRKGIRAAPGPGIAGAPEEGRAIFTVLPLSADHRYRIVGRIRWLFFWAGSDDVGGARVTWRSDGSGTRALALLIGSDPERAPRGINQWGYIREELRPDATEVFGVRTVTDVESVADADARFRRRETTPLVYGALCSHVTSTDSTSASASVRVSERVTFRDFNRALDAVARAESWDARHTSRPVGAAPGFLTAIERLMTASLNSTKPPSRPFSFIYKNVEFELSLPHVEPIAEFRTVARTVRHVLDGEFVIRNRQTGSTTDFGVTYGTEGAFAGVPLRATYQPNWWFKIQLDLDDALDLPADPGGDAMTLGRLADVCGSAVPSRWPRRGGK